MIGVTQTIFLGDPSGLPGNCLQAAVATLLGRPLIEVPHFAAALMWEEYMIHYARNCGYTMYDVHRPPDFGLMFGRTVRSETECHAVAVVDDEIWDPHPSRAGLTRVLRMLAWERHDK